MGRPLRKADLPKVNRELEALVKQPQLLDQARTRFSKTPPQRTTPAPPPHPFFIDLRTEEEQLREQQSDKLIYKQRFSEPNCLFWNEVDEEALFDLHLRNAIIRAKSEGRRVFLVDLKDFMDNASVDNTKARETIQKQWVERGIWKAEWKSVPCNRNEPSGYWHHGGSLELDSQSEIDIESAPDPVGSKKRHPDPSRPKSNEETQHNTERRAALEREHEASRPYYLFIYQLSKARQRIQQLLKLGGASDEDPVDINTKAYEYVKNSWIEKNLWIDKWGVMPGMKWMYEYTLEDVLADPSLLAAPQNVPPSPRSRSSSAAVSVGTQETFHSVFDWEQSPDPTEEQEAKDEIDTLNPRGEAMFQAILDAQSFLSGPSGSAGNLEAPSDGITRPMRWNLFQACLAPRETKSLGRGSTEEPSTAPHMPLRRSERLPAAKRARYT